MSTPNPYAAALAEAEASLSRAEAVFSEARQHEQAIRRRIHEIGAEQAFLRQKRIDGIQEHQDAAELFAMDGDLETLNTMAAEAKTKADALEPIQARATLEGARHHWQTHNDTEKLAALTAKAADIDALLVRCIAEIRETGRAISKPMLHLCWRPSEALEMVIRREIPPR